MRDYKELPVFDTSIVNFLVNRLGLLRFDFVFIQYFLLRDPFASPYHRQRPSFFLISKVGSERVEWCEVKPVVRGSRHRKKNALTFEVSGVNLPRTYVCAYGALETNPFSRTRFLVMLLYDVLSRAFRKSFFLALVGEIKRRFLRGILKNQGRLLPKERTIEERD